MDRLLVTTAVVEDDWQATGYPQTAFFHAINGIAMHADSFGLHIKQQWESGTRLYPWHTIKALSYTEPLPDVSGPGYL